MNDEIKTLLKIIQHKNRVAAKLKLLAIDLDVRAQLHDNSKFEFDEFEGFCELDKNRKHEKEVYGSKTYEKGIKVEAVQLHFSRNPHHPEFYPHGLDDMTLVDIIEMLIDWEVARQTRDLEEDMDVTWRIRQERFQLSDNEINFLRLLWERMS